MDRNVKTKVHGASDIILCTVQYELNYCIAILGVRKLIGHPMYISSINLKNNTEFYRS